MDCNDSNYRSRKEVTFFLLLSLEVRENTSYKDELFDHLVLKCKVHRKVHVAIFCGSINVGYELAMVIYRKKKAVDNESPEMTYWNMQDCTST
jgi:hypothetical protein